MHSDVVVIKLKSSKSESAKKICTFLDYFFLSILEARASAVAPVGLGPISLHHCNKIKIIFLR